jgi:AcrR family transcriptional regulator
VVRQQRAELTRARLVASAAELFDRNGFIGTNIDDISRSAGVTKGALYFHFPAKTDIVAAVQEPSRDLLRQAAASVGAATGVQAMIDLSQLVAGWLRDEAGVRASFRMARECAEQGRPFIDFFLEWQNILHRLAGRAAAAGELADGVPVEGAVTVVLALCMGIEMLWASGISQHKVAQTLAESWAVILPGLIGSSALGGLDLTGSRTGIDPAEESRPAD